MKIGEIIEVEGVRYIAQEEILACKGCYFEYPDNADCYDKFGCKSEDKVIFVKIPVELIEKIEQFIDAETPDSSETFSYDAQGRPVSHEVRDCGGSVIITAGSCTTQICSPTARVAGSEVVFSSWSCQTVLSVTII